MSRAGEFWLRRMPYAAFSEIYLLFAAMLRRTSISAHVLIGMALATFIFSAMFDNRVERLADESRRLARRGVRVTRDRSFRAQKAFRRAWRWVYYDRWWLEPAAVWLTYQVVVQSTEADTVTKIGFVVLLGWVFASRIYSAKTK